MELKSTLQNSLKDMNLVLITQAPEPHPGTRPADQTAMVLPLSYLASSGSRRVHCGQDLPSGHHRGPTAVPAPVHHWTPT